MYLQEQMLSDKDPSKAKAEIRILRINMGEKFSTLTLYITTYNESLYFLMGYGHDLS
jgi:hypothetical protein